MQIVWHNVSGRLSACQVQAGQCTVHEQVLMNGRPKVCRVFATSILTCGAHDGISSPAKTWQNIQQPHVGLFLILEQALPRPGIRRCGTLPQGSAHAKISG